MQTSAGLPNGGHTAHYLVSYDDSLSSGTGLDLAVQLMAHLDDDYALIQSWFVGVQYHFTSPINVHLSGADDGARWFCPSEAVRFWFPINVDLMPGPTPTTGLLRYLVVSEVTEMFMASQGREWYGSVGLFNNADEGSMGESLSRFLAAEFLAATGVSSSIFTGFHVGGKWIDAASRDNFVDISMDDIQPHMITGCGVLFLAFLRHELGFTIQQIIAAAAPTMAGVHTKLTGMTDAWTSFRDLVNLHYPQDGSIYASPLDNVFPVADLAAFDTARQLTWITNGQSNVAYVRLTHGLPVDVQVTLTSSEPTIVSVPAMVATDGIEQIPLTVLPQAAGFTGQTVTLTASYAGQQLSLSVEVVRPENLTLPPLQIVASVPEDPCAQANVEGTPQSFSVKNATVFADPSHLSYQWTVAGATAGATNTATLTIPALPPAGTHVVVGVEIVNGSGLRASGSLELTTAHPRRTLEDMVHRLDCAIRNLSEANRRIPPWVPIENGVIVIDRVRIGLIRTRAESIAVVARHVAAAAKAIESYQAAE
jgi:hypothetical protein